MSAADATKSDVKQINRYPGLRPFVKNDNIIFFGRSTETEQLLDSIRVNKTFILFGKSGLGKSSLINAGIIPRLIAENYYPVLIRFYNTKKNPNDIVTDEIKKHICEEISSDNEKQKSDLSGLLGRWDKEQKPILIFDQFEEFFYYESKKREALISELAFIVTNDLFIQTDASNSQPHLPLRKVDVKLLFLIRSDRLNLMNEISEKIPGIFNNRFQLKPLLKEKAEQATVLPAQIPDTESDHLFFKTRPYEYSLDTIKMILNSLSNKDGEIESSQLQIICQELEEIAENKSKKQETGKSAPTEVTIEVTDFGEEAGIREILNRFYWKQLEKLACDKDLIQLEKSGRESTEPNTGSKSFYSKKYSTPTDNYVVIQIRTLIENELVSGSKRIIQSETKVREFLQNIYPSVTQIGDRDKVDVIIDKLLDLRLIREEDSHLGKVYEISHDTLLESVMKARAERKKKEDQEKVETAERLLLEQKQKAEREEKLKDKAREERKAADEARMEAVEAQNIAIHAQHTATQAQLKAKKRLRYAVASFVFATLCAVFLIFFIVKLQNEKNKNQQVYAQVLTFNAARAYGDNNHALAFNLVQQADKLLDNDNRFTDSLLRIWNLHEYSGDNVQVSRDEQTLACNYKDNTLQLFHLKDSLRKNNPYVIINNVNYFKMSADGSIIYTVDTVTKTISFYNLYNKENKLTSALLWKHPYTGTPWESNIINKQYFVVPQPDYSLLIYNLKNKRVDSFSNYGAFFSESNFIGSNKLYIASYKSFSDNSVSEINLNNGEKRVMPSAYLLHDSTYNNYSYLYNADEKKIYHLERDSMRPIIDASKLSNNFSISGVIETNLYYILEGANNYVFVIKNNPLPTVLPEVPNRTVYTLGQRVKYSGNQVMFLVDSTLYTMTSMGNFIKKPVHFTSNDEFINSIYSAANCFLSTDHSKIYYLNSILQVAGIIQLSPTPVYSRLNKKTTNNYFKLRNSDLFKSNYGLVKIDNMVKDRPYWQNFYEPLSKKELFGSGQ